MQPPPVGGKSRVRFIERCPKERLRLAVGHSQHQDVSLRGGIEFMKGQQLPIRAEGQWSMEELAGG
jgi:hypothetical protein